MKRKANRCCEDAGRDMVHPGPSQNGKEIGIAPSKAGCIFPKEQRTRLGFHHNGLLIFRVMPLACLLSGKTLLAHA